MISIMKDKKKLQKLAAVLLALALWQAAAMALNQKILLASPLSVLARLATIWQEPAFFASIWFSFIRIVGGFSLALGNSGRKVPYFRNVFLAHIHGN